MLCAFYSHVTFCWPVLGQQSGSHLFLAWLGAVLGTILFNIYLSREKISQAVLSSL